MSLIDCQAHLYSRTYFEAHVHRRHPPRAERAEGGYVFHSPRGDRRFIPPSHYEIDDQMAELDAQGVDIVVSSMGSFNVDHLPPDRAVELAMQLNEERAELERRYAGRYFGLALLPMQDAQAAIETLEHAVRTLGTRGVCIGTDVAGGSIADPARHSVFRRIAELGVPLFVHPTSPTIPVAAGRPGGTPGGEAPSSAVAAALDLISSGVLDRHPTLRVVPMHPGGALSYLLPRSAPASFSCGAGAGPFERPLSQYLGRLYTDTVSLDAGALRLAVDGDGANHLLYGSDYPYRRPEATLELIRRELGGDDLDRALFRNAAALLGLGRPSPAPGPPVTPQASTP